MNTAELHPASVPIRKGQIHRLQGRRGHRIEALAGSLWVTLDHDLRDIVIEPGDGFDIDREGDTLVSALSDARYLVLDPVTFRPAPK